MAFTLTPSETFKHEVKTQFKTESGVWREESFVGIFKRTAEEDREERLRLGNRELLKLVMVGWDMKAHPTGESVEFNEANFAAFLSLSGPVRDTCIAYWNANVGSKVKN